VRPSRPVSRRRPRHLRPRQSRHQPGRRSSVPTTRPAAPSHRALPAAVAASRSTPPASPSTRAFQRASPRSRPPSPNGGVTT